MDTGWDPWTQYLSRGPRPPPGQCWIPMDDVPGPWKTPASMESGPLIHGGQYRQVRCITYAKTGDCIQKPQLCTQAPLLDVSSLTGQLFISEMVLDTASRHELELV